MIDQSSSYVYQYMNQEINYNKHNQYGSVRMRWAGEQQRKQLRQRIFGKHYNYTKVSLNKEKKYLIQEERNTEIERSNRLLLQKIQRISKGSLHIKHKRAVTEEGQRDITIINPKQPQYINRVNSKSEENIFNANITPIRRVLVKRQVLFKCTQKISGKSFSITVFTEKQKYIISAEWGGNSQKIIMDMNDYLNLLQGHFQNDPKGILKLLRFNGTALELSGIKEQQIIFEDQKLSLPLIRGKKELEKL